MHYKLYILLGVILALVSCTKQGQVVPPKLASETDCQRVYHHMLELAVEKVDGEHSLTPEWHNMVLQTIDQYWRNEGKTDRFLRSCNAYMTQEQAECAMHTAQMDDITACVRLAPRRKP